MSADRLIVTLEKLLGLHQNLYQLAIQKTDVLKKDNVEDLKKVLQQEQIYVQAIKQVDAERINETASFLGSTTDLTMTMCIEQANGREKAGLEQLYAEFLEVMSKLKAVNTLNQQLTHQALQFVSMSLDMLMPQEQSATYGKPVSRKQQETKRRSLFDSKA